MAATNEDLERRVEEGTFRQDLYYRLKHLPVLIPPLREREGDLLLLIDYFPAGIGATFELSPELRQLLLTHQWRGNIRELRNVVEYFSYTGSPLVGPEDLPPTFHYLSSGAPVKSDLGQGDFPPLKDCPRRTSDSYWSSSTGRTRMDTAWAGRPSLRRPGRRGSPVLSRRCGGS